MIRTAALLLALAMSTQAANERIVALGGALTETIYALGAQDQLVGVDSSSTFPAAATKLPQVGYQRKISAEGVLSLKPTLVLATPESGPPAALQQLRQAGVKIVEIPGENSVSGAQEKVRALGVALGIPAKGEALAQAISDKAAAAEIKAQTGRKPRVLFLYARSGAGLLAAGTKTEGEAVIQLAGGENAITGYPGYRPLTAEAAVAAAPDFIVSLRDGVESLGGEAKVYEAPGLALTPAGKNRRVILMDSLLLLGFGPRTGDAILQLAEALHPAS